ncbi:MAG: alpha/beta fold hydrolase [Leptospiraceae bacterium]|nr:alpha/beta fold hydrolase [Leptospiraceae bacterium]
MHLRLLIFFVLFNCANVNLKGKIYHPKTVDGWELTMEHFPSKNPTILRKYPVILCHGLMGNRKNFTLNEAYSIANQLSLDGYDVWTLDLRGRPEGGSPNWFFGNYTFNYSFDDYFKKDVDTALNFVIEKTGANKVNWIGHSMGGMIIYARIGTLGDDRIANLITIGSPFIFHHPTDGMNTMKSFNVLMPVVIFVPTGYLSKISAITRIRPKFLVGQFWYSPNMDDEYKFLMQGTNDESKDVLRQFSFAVGNDGFYSLDKKTSYTSNLKNIKIPVMLISGKRDFLGSPYTVRYAFDSIGSKDKTFLSIGKSEGSSEDYGHVDLISAKQTILEDIVTPIKKWLNERNKMSSSK